MKVKSATLRTLLIAYALFKYSDEQHKLNITKLNAYLKQYGLECKTRALLNTVNALKSCGINVKNTLEYDGRAHWIENRPLKDYELRKLIFAITTNPYLSDAQTSEILSSLKTLVTVFQDSLLVNSIRSMSINSADEKLINTYAIVHEAILTNRRVVYCSNYLKVNRATGTVKEIPSYKCLFTPKEICLRDDKLFMVGYHHILKRIMAIDLNKISDISISKQQNVKNKNAVEHIQSLLCEMNSNDYLPCQKDMVIYQGPITLMFKGKYLDEIYKRFGAPSEPVKQDTQALTQYVVESAKLTVRDLVWISELPDLGVRLKGPGALVESVKKYYNDTSRIIIDARKRYLLYGE